MPWEVKRVRDQRIELVLRAMQGNESVSSLCREFKISRPTAYLWINRYKASGGVDGLVERSRRPICSPGKTPSEKEEEVISLRRRWGWGAKKLQVLLREQGTDLPVVTINRIIKRNGLIVPEESHPKATTRFERSKPNELWQMDFKGYYTTRFGKVHPLSILDDHSRYVVGLSALDRTDAKSVWSKLVRVFREYGLPDAMLMDHGCPWWGSSGDLGLSLLSVALIKQGIRLIYSGIRHPQTQGKVERFHRTLDQEVRRRGEPGKLNSWTKLLNRIQFDYNERRPHEALSMATPASLYRPSLRAYNPHPKAWEYPVGAEVLQVKSGGALPYRGKGYYVSTSLEGEYVQVHRLGSKIIIDYRHMRIREIDLNTGKSVLLLDNPDCKASPETDCKA